MNSKKEDKEYEECIYFLAEKLQENSNDSNTLIHSIRVGLNMKKDGYSINVIKAGFLHDIFEDTNISENILRKKYDNEIVELIKSTTADYSIKNEKEILIDMYKRALNYGKDALILKCYDIEDKMDYYKESTDRDIVYMHNYKYNLFLTMSKDSISQYSIWKKMKRKHKQCKKVWKNKNLI